MTKQEFLDELKRSISVLQDEEQVDIISEYEQHIDMKMKSGLTEEEAIADFGGIQKLTVEILEAYHVKTDFVTNQHHQTDASKQLLQETGKNVSKVKEKVFQVLKRTGGGIKHFFMGCFSQLKRPWLWLGACIQKKKEQKELTNQNSKEVEDRKSSSETTVLSHIKSGIRAISRGIQKFVLWCMAVLIWCIRLGWNLWWIGVGALAAFFGLITLFGTGALVIIVTQGYPLVGVTIGCVGITCCFAALTGLCFSILCHLHKEKEVSLKEVSLEEGEKQICVE